MNERITELRKALDLSMDEFGKRLGVTRSSISNIESGRRSLTDQMFISICREFNVRDEWLKDGIGTMFEREAKDEFEAFAKKYNLNQLEYIVFEHYVNLDEPERKSVFDFVTGVFADFNESPIALSAPAEMSGDEVLPDAAFKDAPAVDGIPKTPEELEKEFPPVKEENHEAG